MSLAYQVAAIADVHPDRVTITFDDGDILVIINATRRQYRKINREKKEVFLQISSTVAACHEWAAGVRFQVVCQPRWKDLSWLIPG